LGVAMLAAGTAHDLACAVAADPSTITPKHPHNSSPPVRRRAALVAVKVSDTDITLIQTHMELSDKVAEQVLREHGGDVVAALRHLVST